MLIDFLRIERRRIMRIRFLKRGKWKKLDRTDKILLILYTIVVVLIICMVWNYVGSWSIGENLSEFRAKRKGIILILVLPISFLFAIILKIREIRREKKKNKEIKKQKEIINSFSHAVRRCGAVGVL